LVKHGETVLIMDRGRPVARMEKAWGGDDPEGRILRLERNGAVTRAHHPLPKAWLNRPRVKPLAGGDILQALLDERDENR
jgi:antitoxin (DNA-binding transcriptional repressor) of toxin-antitoxin stability system